MTLLPEWKKFLHGLSNLIVLQLFFKIQKAFLKDWFIQTTETYGKVEKSIWTNCTICLWEVEKKLPLSLLPITSEYNIIKLWWNSLTNELVPILCTCWGLNDLQWCYNIQSPNAHKCGQGRHQTLRGRGCAPVRCCWSRPHSLCCSPGGGASACLQPGKGSAHLCWKSITMSSIKYMEF